MRKLSAGFSLIELLVVFMIIAMVMSVVAPSVNQMYRQHMAQQEMRMLQQYVKNISSRAYSQYQDFTILLEGNRLSVVSNSASSNLDSANNVAAEEDESIIDLYPDALEEIPAEDLTVQSSDNFDVYFEHLHFTPSSILALKSGHIQRQSIEVAVGSKGVVKQVAIKGLAFIDVY